MGITSGAPTNNRKYKVPSAIMSMRRPEPVTEAPAPQEQMFKLELPDAPPSTDAAAATDAPATAELQWKDLTPTEQSAASLGVDPAAWKPIAFMNSAAAAPL